MEGLGLAFQMSFFYASFYFSLSLFLYGSYMGGTALAFEISPFGHFQFFMVDSSEITSNITRQVCIRRYWQFSSFVVDSSEITSNRTRQVCIRIA